MMMMRVDNMLAAPEAVDTTSWIQLERSIKKKLGEITSVKLLDAEMFKLVREKETEDEIPQADDYK